ncbi:MAG: hypothetical protein COV76_01245 [Candidatus Omnitrophica bacterium CG11_big_fil_rev_8_21_14_0_20_64_10]|nr:MAG: hypothetical protein COV76_01245 [Candidatus Omnitrophica bacterium CG11_big_fil_rev_8_21_14_0_20_64_10]
MTPSVASPFGWELFAAVVALLLVIDLGLFHRKAHAESIREAVIWSAVWIGVALLFNVFVWGMFGPAKGLEFLAAYLIEKSLSMDNIFVFVAIFSYFHVKSAYQHRVLFLGIVGAIVMRAGFIAAGITLLERFHWMIYLMGAFLVFTGVRFLKQEEGVHPEWNPVVRLVQRIFPVTRGFREQHFLVREGGRWMATPLLVVLLVVETSDVLFAVDSIPAVLAVSRDPFIVYTSNVFAILGLRALYFVLAGMIPKFRHLRFGLCGILVFVGIKMLISHWVHIPVGVSLAVVGIILAGSVGLSLARPARPFPGSDLPAPKG